MTRGALAALPLILATERIESIRRKIYKYFETLDKDPNDYSAFDLDSNLTRLVLRRTSRLYCINICRDLRLNLPRYISEIGFEAYYSVPAVSSHDLKFL